MPEGYDVVDHTADWALRVWGADMGELLHNAAFGMSSLLVNDIASVPQDETRSLSLEADDPEGLLVEWLSELAYWAEIESLVFTSFEVEANSNKMEAEIRGGRVAELVKHIKAVTYHDLQVIRTPNGLEATIVFDV